MVLFVSVLSSALALAQASSQPACAGVGKATFERAADLPKGALAAFGAPMAEPGQPFQATDVVGNPPRPIFRFRSAEQDGCMLRLDYEHGGRGYDMATATFFDDGSGWKLIGQRYFHDRQKP